MSTPPSRSDPPAPSEERPRLERGETPAPVPSPTGPRSCMGSLTALLGALLGGAYILNPTAGLFELAPDNAPLVGNLDEAAAAALLIFGLRYLFSRRR